MLRVCKDRKRKYVGLGISINPIFWDFSMNKPKPNCPNKERLEALIAEKIKSYSETILEMKTSSRDFTASSLVDKVNRPQTKKTVDEIFQCQFQRLGDENRRNYLLSCKQLYNSLILFNKHLDIYFSEIDISWLRKYETWLRKNRLSDNSIAIRFRTLRAIYNLAIEENCVKAQYYPFKTYKVAKLSKETAKRSISKVDVTDIINYQTSNPHMQFALDLFAFTYYAGGINFADIAYLTKDNISSGKLIYSRRKTKKLIKIPLQSQASFLLDKYNDMNSPYLFPILSSFHKTEIQKANRIHKVISKVNRYLKEIGDELKIPIKVTTYVARHSQATVMKKSGVSTAIIREIMGHSSEKVTQIYLDSFDNEQVDEAMKNLF
jgi:site-specific recombinase XerD